MVQYTAKQKAAYYKKQAQRVSGSGAYTTRGALIPGANHPTQNTWKTGKWANRGAIIGGAVGGAYGGPIGSAIGSVAGRTAFHYPAKLMGSGSYHTVKSGKTTSRPQVPTFGNQGDYVTINHREYIGDVISSATPGEFKSDTYNINPGDVNTFPWLSNLVGSSYQQYRFDGLKFEFRSTSGESLNSTNTALGSVFSAINYDWSDPDFTTRSAIENSSWSSNARPSDNFDIFVECAKSQTGMNQGLLYVNQGNIPPNVDPKTYFLGKLQIASQGLQGSSVAIGSIYCTYRVRLYKQVMSRPLSNGNLFSRIRGGVSAAAPLGLIDEVNSKNCDTMGVGITNGGTVLQISTENLRVGSTFIPVSVLHP